MKKKISVMDVVNMFDGEIIDESKVNHSYYRSEHNLINKIPVSIQSKRTRNLTQDQDWRPMQIAS